MVKLEIDLKIANRNHLITPNGELIVNQLFFLRRTSGVFDSGVYYSFNGMNKENIEEYLKRKMVYVPVNPIDSFSVKNTKG